MDTNLLLNYLLCFTVGIGIPFFFLRNFLIEWFKVKRSGGRKVLVKIRNPTQVYFKAGTIDKNGLQYRARKRPDNPSPGRLIPLPENYTSTIYKAWGVSVIEVDDYKSCILIWNGESYEAVTGYNAEYIDELIKTALAKPSLLDGIMTNKMFQICVLGLLVIIGIMIYMQGKQIGAVDGHLQMIYNQTSAIYDRVFNATLVR